MNETYSEEESFLKIISDLPDELREYRIEKRRECARCGRPVTVCWCPFLPKERVNISTTVYVLQHPFEELRKLKTAPMLHQSLEEGKCHIIRGKKFGSSKRNIKYPQLNDVLESPNTVLLFPGEDAVDITELPPLDMPYNLVVLDGTWTQARGMYANNKILHVPKKVMINCDHKSRYVIRTQPTESSLSTLECVAIALSVLEKCPQLGEMLTAPLVALCDFQKNYGAVEHQSREYKIAHGLWQKKLPDKLLKRMERERQKTEKEAQEGHS